MQKSTEISTHNLLVSGRSASIKLDSARFVLSGILRLKGRMEQKLHSVPHAKHLALLLIRANSLYHAVV